MSLPADADRRPGPLRVALSSGAYTHIADGVTRTLGRLVGDLTAHGADVHVFAPTVAHPAVEAPGTLVPVPSVAIPGRPEYRFPLGLWPAQRRHLDAWQPDLVHLATPDLTGVHLLRWARRHGVPTVATYHTHFPSYLAYYGAERLLPLGWRYLRWFYRKVDRLLVPSASMRDVLRAHGVPGDLGLWGRGVDTDLFSPARRSDAWRTAVGAGPEDVVVTYVGRLVLEKGLDVVADTFGALRSRVPGLVTVVVGEGPIRRDLEARMPGTRFLGHLDAEALATAYASSDVFVFPSDTETFGNVTLEAMASGVVPVVADATGSRSLVRDGETGHLCPPRNAAAFTAAIAALAAAADRRRAMGRAARVAAEQRSWPVVLASMRDAYADLTGLCTDGSPVL